MARQKYPSDKQEQFMLRLPEGLRGRVKAAADKAGRSMNSEIVLLLAEKFPEPQPLDSQVGALLDLVGILKKNIDTRSVNHLVAQMIDTLQGAALGQVEGIPDDVRESIRDQLDDWFIDQAKEAEIRAYNRAADPEDD